MIRMLLAVGGLLASPLAVAWHFVILGDTPYSTFERQSLPEMFAAIRADPPAFVVHVGDIKAGGARCDDALYADRRALFDTLGLPLVFTPGDNDWTDCRRQSNGAYDPRERLAHLRTTFYIPQRPLGGADLARTSQPGYPENQRWTREGILFVTVHMVGSYDNTADRQESPPRRAAGRRWMSAALAQAERMDARALVIFIHADPHFQAHARGRAPMAYRAFLAQLRRAALASPRPMVLVHGDSHRQIIDHPLLDDAGQPIGHFTRVETFGYPFMGWVRAQVSDDETAPLEFSARPWTPSLGANQ